MQLPLRAEVADQLAHIFGSAVVGQIVGRCLVEGESGALTEDRLLDELGLAQRADRLRGLPVYDAGAFKNESPPDGAPHVDIFRSLSLDEFQCHTRSPLETISLRPSTKLFSCAS